MSVRLTILPVALLLALAACDDAPAPASDDTGRAATGEVLEGSISDEMLPIEGLSSQPPVAAPLPGEGGAASGGATAAPAAGAASGDAPAAADSGADAARAETPEEEAPAPE